MKRIAIYGALLLLATMSVLAKSNNAASFLPNHTGEWTSAPKNRPASFSNLRTHGAFLVSSSCSNNAVECATIVSLKGRPCKLLNPWKEQGCTVVRAGGKRFTYTESIISLTTSPNEVLKLMPATSALSN